MNDWLNYAGSGSSRAYTNNTLSHSNVSNLVPYGSPQYYADTRLIKAYAEKMKKLKSEYKSLKSDYNKYVTLYNHNKDMAESQESNRSEFAKSGHALSANRLFEKNVWKYKKDASDAKNEAVSYLTKIKTNVDSQKKVRDDVKSIDDSDYMYGLKRDGMRKRKTDPLFIPDEMPSNMNQIIKQSYFDMPADEFIMHTENGNVYNSLNNKLDQLYKSTQDLINLIRNLRTSYENMVTAARNTKKNVTLADSKSKMWVAAYDKIDSDIDSANIGDMQKTALRNKLNNIQSSVDNIIGKLATGMEVDVSMSTLDALINEIQSSIRR